MNLRITIKCKGLWVRTKDLNMAYGILHEIKEHGIMEHSLVPNWMLEQASILIDGVSGILKKVKDKFKTPDFAPACDDCTEDLMETPSSVVNYEDKAQAMMKDAGFSDEAIERSKALSLPKPKSKGFKSAGWTVEEDQLIADLRDKKPNKVAKNAKLLKRHSALGIKTRLSVIKNQKWDQLSSDRAKILQAYMSGKKVTNGVVNIKKVNTVPGKPWLLKEAHKNDKIVNAWTEEELDILRKFIKKNIGGKRLYAMLPNRTKSAIQVKKQVLRGMRKNSNYTPKAKADKVRNTTKMKNWSTLANNYVADNLDMKVDELMKSPLLEGRSKQSVSCRRSELRTKAKKLSGTQLNEK